MDGTFSSQPQIFAQLYTIHVKINNEFVPQLWCLLPDKRGATYTRLFQLLKQEALNINVQLMPASIHIDFEMAVIQAVRAEFQIDASGCRFHYSQSVLRHLQQVGPGTSHTSPRLVYSLLTTPTTRQKCVSGLGA